MSRFSHHAGGRRRFKLLRGGLDEAPATATDQSWQQFCRHIGWQQLSEPALPDDYEEQMLARLFGAHRLDGAGNGLLGAGDGLGGAGDGLGGAGDGLGGAGDEGNHGDNVVQLSTVRAQRQLPPHGWDTPTRAAGRPASLQPAVGPAQAEQRMPETQAAHGLSWLAAVAAAVLLGVVGITMLSQSGNAEPITTMPAPVPERTVPRLDTPERNIPSTPEHAVKPAPETPQKDVKQRPPLVPLKSKPPGRLAQLQTSELRTAKLESTELEPTELESDRLETAELRTAPPTLSDRLDRAALHRPGHAPSASIADARQPRHLGHQLPTEPAGLDSTALTPTAMEPVALAAIVPSLSPAGAWAEHEPSDALWKPHDPASPSPALAAHTPWRAATSWYGVGMTAPREVSGLPAGVRVTAQLDPIEAGRRLFGQL